MKMKTREKINKTKICLTKKSINLTNDYCKDKKREDIYKCQIKRQGSQ